jgi:hypothetical protein
MPSRFRCPNPPLEDIELADVDAILDALEAALVTAETPLFDGARQTWQPVGGHPEVRAAWAERARYRPPGGSGLDLPALPPPEQPFDEELALRRAAFAQVRARERAGLIAADLPDPRRPRFVAAGVVGVLLLLVLVGWLVVTLAGRVADAAARAVGR